MATLNGNILKHTIKKKNLNFLPSEIKFQDCVISCGIAMRSFEGIMFLQVLWSQFLVLSIAMQSGAAPVAQRKRRIPSPESVSQRLAASPGGKAPGFTCLVLPELAVVCGCSLVLQLESVRGPGSSLPSAVQGWVWAGFVSRR